MLLRCNGVDTGAPFRNQLVMHAGLDVWAYRMSRHQKFKCSIELSKALIELKAAKILHCDIKPANTVLHQPAHGWPVLKLIDFGEANTVEDALGDIAGMYFLLHLCGFVEGHGGGGFASSCCNGAASFWISTIGTPGYMAPEMEKAGSASTGSDMYSTGMYLVRSLCCVARRHIFPRPGFSDIPIRCSTPL